MGIELLKDRLERAKKATEPNAHGFSFYKTWQEAARALFRKRFFGSDYASWTYDRKRGSRTEKMRGFQFDPGTMKGAERVGIRAAHFSDEVVRLHHTGYFSDAFQENTYRGCILFFNRVGWVPGYFDKNSGCVVCEESDFRFSDDVLTDSDIKYDDAARSAAITADSMAENDAQACREADEAYTELQRVEDEEEETKQERAEELKRLGSLLPARNARELPACTLATIRADIRAAVSSIRRIDEKLLELADDVADKRHTCELLGAL